MNFAPYVRALVVVPVPAESTPSSAIVGLFIRARASVTGTCHCGGIRVGTTLEHEDDCPAIGLAVEQALADGNVGWAAIKAYLPAELLLAASA
jgi:hypothetical protein